MGGALAAVDRSTRWLEDAAMTVAAIGLSAMALSTAIDVLMRYVFNSPLFWVYPVVTNYLVVFLFFGAVSGTQRVRHHIGVELIVRRLPPRWREALSAAVTTITLIFFLAAAYCGFGLFLEAWETNQALPGVVAWLRWPSYVVIPIGFGLLSLRLLVQILQSIVGAATGHIPDEPHNSAVVGLE
jgi:TRAP-type C4-dicarboxylate transport system permease small subunit